MMPFSFTDGREENRARARDERPQNLVTPFLDPQAATEIFHDSSFTITGGSS
jgi:hypothetical protein